MSAPWEASAGPIELARVAEAAEAAGFAYLGVCDHVAIPEHLSSAMSTFWVDPISTLGWLAAHTQRIALLTHVYVLPYRHALMAAKQFSTLDWLAGGRVIAGIGAGHVEAEFAALGVDFAGRGPALDQAVADLAELMEQEFVDGLGATPRPVQSPRPPLWIAGSSPAGIRRAAQFGDGWLPQGPATRELLDRLRSKLDVCDRDIDDFAVGHISMPVHVGEAKWDVGTHTITGAPAQIAERLLDGLDPMVNQMQVRVVARSVDEFCDQLASFGAEVMPMLTTV